MPTALLRPALPRARGVPTPTPPRRHFAFNVSWKRRAVLPASADATRSGIALSTGTYIIPHPKKVDTGGEDALFVSSYNGGVLALADGVSGWAERNVNPALFSQELMRNVSRLVEDEEVNFDPVTLLKKAHAATTSMGSATVIVAMLENGVLKIANVGDCGLRVLRGGQIIFCTSPLEHYFDCPYQISSEKSGQTHLDATVCSIDLKERDIIVMGSDGLFDNVFDQEIVSTVSGLKDVSEAAKALAELANNHSSDSSFDSPYSFEARSKGFDVPFWKKITGQKLTGGKPDDITVIVSQVVVLKGGPSTLVESLHCALVVAGSAKKSRGKAA